MRIRHPLINSTLSAGMTRSFRMLFRTLRIEYDFFVNDTNPYQIAQGPTYIYSVWHDSMVVPVFAGKQPATMALVGQHNDGSYVANVLKSAGIPSARGSSSKGGAAAPLFPGMIVLRKVSMSCSLAALERRLRGFCATVDPAVEVPFLPPRPLAAIGGASARGRGRDGRPSRTGGLRA